MKKKVIIVSVVVVVLAALAAACYFLVPKFVLKSIVGGDVDKCVAAEIITDFSTTHKDVYEVSNGLFTVDIPNNFVEKPGLEALKVSVYKSTDGKKQYMMFNKTDDMSMSLLEPINYGEYDKLFDKEPAQVEEILMTMNYGRPDSYYNVLKAAALTDAKDFTMWDAKKLTAFTVFAQLKNSLYESKEVYIYERDNIRAIIKGPGEKANYHIVDIMNTDDLNTAYSITVTTDDFKDVLALMNSFEFVSQ